MLELKPLAREAVPRALERAERYRLLNEPVEAESICLDVLEADPENQSALVTLLLALTDQFEEGIADAVTRAREVLPRLPGEYERAYYTGIVFERRAKAQLRQGGPGCGYAAHESMQQALRWFERADAVRPPGNDDARLRWNTCVRILRRRSELRPAPEERSEPPLE
jgi:hypothetical protein